MEKLKLEKEIPGKPENQESEKKKPELKVIGGTDVISKIDEDLEKNASEERRAKIADQISEMPETSTKDAVKAGQAGIAMAEEADEIGRTTAKNDFKAEKARNKKFLEDRREDTTGMDAFALEEKRKELQEKAIKKETKPAKKSFRNIIRGFFGGGE